jgi:hypothetical protein
VKRKIGTMMGKKMTGLTTSGAKMKAGEKKRSGS